jgi:GNAT superfamily N-acetyltransferase
MTLLGGSDERGCWCQSWRGTTPSRAPTGSRRSTLRAQLAGDPPPGAIAFLDDEPVGWCGFAPRHSLPRLQRSRTIPAIDGRDVWAIGCFVVRPGYRRQGVTRALLEAVVRLAREAGAPGLEGYPIDPEGQRVDTSFGFVGFMSTFERAGFRRVVETAAQSDRRPRWLMRLDFPEAGAQ